MIERKDIQKLAELSRIHLQPEEEQSLQTQIDSILGYIDQIKKASLASSQDPEVGLVHNVWREDTSAHESGIHTEKILAEAPMREGNYLKVKKIL